MHFLPLLSNDHLFEKMNERPPLLYMIMSFSMILSSLDNVNQSEIPFAFTRKWFNEMDCHHHVSKHNTWTKVKGGSVEIPLTYTRKPSFWNVTSTGWNYFHQLLGVQLRMVWRLTYSKFQKLVAYGVKAHAYRSMLKCVVNVMIRHLAWQLTIVLHSRLHV